VPEPALRRKPGSEWAALEVLAHLRDRERLLGERIALFAEGATLIPNWDEEAAAANGRYLRETPVATLAEFQELRQQNIQHLVMVATTAWDQEAQHEAQGPYSLRTEVERVVAHDIAHLRQLEALLTS